MNDKKCPTCNGQRRLCRCHGCGTLYRHIHKYSDCGNAACEGEDYDDVPCPDCTTPASAPDAATPVIA